MPFRNRHTARSPEPDGTLNGRIDESLKARAIQLRTLLSHGKQATQLELDSISAELEKLKPYLRPRDNVERLPLIDETGMPIGTHAPRWLCHLLALRHRCVHVLFVWSSPTMGDTLILQIRNWNMDDSPGRLDVSAGGHVTVAESTGADAVWAEVGQETGLKAGDFEGPPEYIGGYAFDEERNDDNLFNSEWRDVYVARVRQDRFGAIHFPDGELAGIVLVPAREAGSLLSQNIMQIASGLRESLPRCLRHCWDAHKP